MPTELGQYKGHDTITISTPDGKTKITMGRPKARAILGELDALQKFAGQATNATERAQQSVADSNRAWAQSRAGYAATDREDYACSDAGYEEQCERAIGA